MAERKVRVCHGVECPNCGCDGFDDWWHNPTTKQDGMLVTARLRCHGCGRFFKVSRYPDGEHVNEMGGANG